MGGADNHVRYLAEELAKDGHEVHVLHSLDAYDVKRGRMRCPTEPDDVFTHPIETSFSLSAYEAYVLGTSRAVTRRLHDLVEQVRPDVVHHHNISLLGYNILARQGNYVNFYTAHDYWLICPNSTLLRTRSQVCESASCMFCSLNCKRPPQLWRRRTAFKKAISNIDLLIAPSNYAKERITRKLPLNAMTIPNFVPAPPYPIASSGFSNFFLFAGRLEPYKGVLQLIEGFKEVRTPSDSKLIIVGKGSLESAVEKHIKSNDLADRIIKLGWMDQDLLYRLLKDAIALILPSICPENCPLVGLEALSVGTPIIASRVGGLPEIVEKLDRRLLFESRDQLQNILIHFERSETLSDHARRVYEEFYSPRSFIGSYFEQVTSRTNQALVKTVP